MKPGVLAVTTAVILSAAFASEPRALAQTGDAISDGVVRIGLLLDLSGPYSTIAGRASESAARMAVEDFGGTVFGKPIEIVVADDHDSADTASDIARDWFDRQHVDAIMEVSDSSAALAVQAVARNRDKIMSVSGSGAARLTNEACSASAVQYVYDTYAVAHTIVPPLVPRGGNSWFFITVDYSFGYDLERDAAAVVTASGGTVLGDARHPLATTDFTSYLSRAQHSGAKVVAIANSGVNTAAVIKQAVQMHIRQDGQTLAALQFLIEQVANVGLETAQGMMVAEPFYWDLDDDTRAWSKRFLARTGTMPDSFQAGVYSSTTHYLKSVVAAGTDATQPVMQQMRTLPINDFFARNGRIRADGTMVHDMYLFQVKSPAESRYPWDFYKLVATVPGDQAFLPLAQSKCPLVNRPG